VRSRKLLSIALAAAAAAALAGAPLSGAAKLPRIPRLPRAPKVTNYQATLDVAGYIGVKVERDDTAECQPGQDVTIQFDASFELGSPRRTGITIINGAVVSGVVPKRGGVTHKGELVGYRETNYCPPTRREELTEPTCTSGSGKLTAILGSNPEDFKLGDDDLVPLAYPVNLALTRLGGPTQDESCRRYLISGIRSARRGQSELSVFETTAAGIVVPIGASNLSFQRLKRGDTLRRVVTLNGACNHVLIGREAPADASRTGDTSKCTVTGKVYVAVKRTS
jgi:hypothetical protein